MRGGVGSGEITQGVSLEAKIDRILSRAQSQLGEVGGGRRGRSVPVSVRRSVVEYLCAARADGIAWWRITKHLGLCETTLRRWLEDHGQELGGGAEETTRDPVRLLPVDVVGATNPGAQVGAISSGCRVTLVTPNGYRVEGLGVDQIASVLAQVG